MYKNAKYLLEKYVEEKDRDEFKILEKIYLPNAKVTFEIKSDTISFPSEILGNKNIAQVLSTEFNRKYDYVKTYYLSRSFPQLKDFIISNQGWLVIMREKEDNSIRVGTGLYDWVFEKQVDGNLKIAQHKIFIGVMLCLPGFPLSFLDELQSNLLYPWVDKKKAIDVLCEYGELQEISDFIKKN